jgi:hypothetical protein
MTSTEKYFQLKKEYVQARRAEESRGEQENGKMADA